MYKGSVSSIRTGFADLAKTSLLTAPSSPVTQAIIITQSDLANNSGSSAAMGWGYKVIDANWSFGQWDNSETPKFIDDTTDAQDAGATDVALTTTTANDGFVVSATEKFNLVGITLSSTVEVGSPVYEYTYWNGSAWTTLALLSTPVYTSEADVAIVFAAPADWALGGDTDEGITATHYAIRIRATTAPSTAPVATIAWVARLLDYVGSVSDGSTINRIQYVDSSGSRIPTGHSLVAYSSVVSGKNIAYFEYSQV